MRGDGRTSGHAPDARARGLAGEELAEGEDRILTVPNLITLVRLLCLPLFLWLLFGRENYIAAAVLLAALGATDWVDGYVARHFDQVSNFGKMFDPTVDRLLFFVGIGAIMIADRHRYFWSSPGSSSSGRSCCRRSWAARCCWELDASTSPGSEKAARSR